MRPRSSARSLPARLALATIWCALGCRDVFQDPPSKHEEEASLELVLDAAAPTQTVALESAVDSAPGVYLLASRVRLFSFVDEPTDAEVSFTVLDAEIDEFNPMVVSGDELDGVLFDLRLPEEGPFVQSDCIEVSLTPGTGEFRGGLRATLEARTEKDVTLRVSFPADECE